MIRSAILALTTLALACDRPSTTTTTASTTTTTTSTATTTATTTATMTASASASATATASASSAPDAGAPEFATYTNARYGFSIDYPTIMTKNPASANDAGQSFSWKSKASMRAWGFANSAHLTAKSLFDDWARRGGVTTKEQDAAGWTVAGEDRGKQYHSRCVYGADVVVCVELQFDADVKDQFAPLAKHVAESLKAKVK